MNLSKRSLIIIGSIFGLFIVTLAIIGFVTQSKPDSTAPDEQGYVDPGSGEVIKSDKSPQGTEESQKNAIIFPGFSKLIDRGLSPEQVQSVQATFISYSLEKNKQFKEVSLQVDSIRHILPKGSSRTHILTFDITTNRTDKYYTTVEYENTETAKTKLYASDNTTLLFER
ncbi:MAG TPA: hypothetical protein VGO98_00565 [Candidatus Saccharimonadales bacterium]|jgi:hypothetical protein|nr:hypothetical protein [Candidatus Saccharimonadales bacterium]